MRKFKNKKTGVVYNVTADSIAKVFENSDEYTEIVQKGKTTDGKRVDKKTNKPAENEK